MTIVMRLPVDIKNLALMGCLPLPKSYRAMCKLLFLNNHWFQHILSTQVSDTGPMALWLHKSPQDRPPLVYMTLRNVTLPPRNRYFVTTFVNINDSPCFAEFANLLHTNSTKSLFFFSSIFKAFFMTFFNEIIPKWKNSDAASRSNSFLGTTHEKSMCDLYILSPWITAAIRDWNRLQNITKVAVMAVKWSFEFKPKEKSKWH